ncbi:MAG: hypothetical protein OEQ30_04820 [Gammaproteobacteria bacterium]|jgi:hypothetical protein|nr:hypothetical protein [Gammaproteobacteria bacterium]MDH3757825.1 hypothetical protein [Gammaproteobacteria bacterium]MDH3864093.1 hypothetical protein [Gammaproteobacteria bacterium]MDH3905713.1 hypothetical protein [Gammaproteobacteria bacterium]MDH4005869.1 hypothetical protein [Gammaproteobacteria bacterium]
MMLSRIFFITLLVAIITITGCASQVPRASDAGVYEIGRLRITLDDRWYKQSGSDLPRGQALSSTWSREGLERDRLFVTGGVDDGEPIFKASDYPGLPVFRSNMSATETAGFIAKSLQGVLWSGSAVISVSNVRERGFTGLPGFEFELSADVPGAASHRGIAGGFVDEGRLYVTVYLAESPGYFERHRQAAQAVIDSSVPTMKTIRW